MIMATFMIMNYNHQCSPTLKTGGAFKTFSSHPMLGPGTLT